MRQNWPDSSPMIDPTSRDDINGRKLTRIVQRARLFKNSLLPPIENQRLNEYLGPGIEMQ